MFNLGKNNKEKSGICEILKKKTGITYNSKHKVKKQLDKKI